MIHPTNSARRPILRGVRTFFGQLFRREPAQSLPASDSAPVDPNWFYPFDRTFRDEDLEQNAHRNAVGGMWDEIGQWQFELLVQQGLQPTDHFLDVGCGALRGGIHFIRHLETGHYCGIDINASMIDKGAPLELTRAGLTDRGATLLCDGTFDVAKFGRKFDVALAQSVFTHININLIQRCLANVAGVLAPGGRFFATYFDAPQAIPLEPIPRGTRLLSYSDSNPFHYHTSLFEYLINTLPLRMECLGTCGHARGQSVLVFHRT